MGAENPGIRMELIDNNVFQVFEQIDPFGVVRENTGVQHIGIG
jgi:hypothetical protein